MDTVLENFNIEFLDLTDASEDDKDHIKRIVRKANSFQLGANSTDTQLPATVIPGQDVHINGRAEEVYENAVEQGGTVYSHSIQQQQPPQQPQPQQTPVVPMLNPQASVFVNTRQNYSFPAYPSPELNPVQGRQGRPGKPGKRLDTGLAYGHHPGAAPPFVPPPPAYWNPGSNTGAAILSPPGTSVPNSPHPVIYQAIPPSPMFPLAFVRYQPPTAPIYSSPPAPEPEIEKPVPYEQPQQNIMQPRQPIHHHQPPQIAAPPPPTMQPAAPPHVQQPPIHHQPPPQVTQQPMTSNTNIINLPSSPNPNLPQPKASPTPVAVVAVKSNETKVKEIKVDQQQQQQQQKQQHFDKSEVRNGVDAKSSNTNRPSQSSAVVSANASDVVEASALKQPEKTAAQLPPAAVSAPVQPAVVAAPVQPAVVAAPVQPAVVAAPVQPAVVAAPVQPAAPMVPSYASFFNNSSSSKSSPAVGKHKFVASPQQQQQNHHQVNHYASAADQHTNATGGRPESNKMSPAAAAQMRKQGGSVVASPAPSPLAGDPGLQRLAEFLSTYKLDHRAAVLRPRGLTNRSNYCYINATLQALLACPPLYNLLKKLPLQPRKSNAISKSKTPIIDSMVQFVNEFEEMSPSLLKSRREKTLAREEKPGGGGGGDHIDQGAAFEPTYVYKMMNSVIRNESAFQVEGRQEDAEEFLSCLLNGLNDEMVELLRLIPSPSSQQPLANGELTNGGGGADDENYVDQDDNKWKEVAGKNKQSITRRTKLVGTPLSQMFQGQWRSKVIRSGSEETDCIQPFFTVPLDIERAHSVKEALDHITAKNTLEGCVCPRTRRSVDAFQQLYLEQLPLVLLLHLKCFHFKQEACSKIIKNVDFSIDLKIEPRLFWNKNSCGSIREREYKLFAVVYHDGKEATKGHYLTDVYHVGYGTWLRYDDANVRPVPESHVLSPKSPRVPYLLYYRRKDTIATHHQPNKPQKTAATES